MGGGQNSMRRIEGCTGLTYPTAAVIGSKRRDQSHPTSGIGLNIMVLLHLGTTERKGATGVWWIRLGQLRWMWASISPLRRERGAS